VETQFEGIVRGPDHGDAAGVEQRAKTFEYVSGHRHHLLLALLLFPIPPYKRNPGVWIRPFNISINTGALLSPGGDGKRGRRAFSSRGLHCVGEVVDERGRETTRLEKTPQMFGPPITEPGAQKPICREPY
jgi:hypothetical protein